MTNKICCFVNYLTIFSVLLLFILDWGWGITACLESQIEMTCLCNKTLTSLHFTVLTGGDTKGFVTN